MKEKTRYIVVVGDLFGQHSEEYLEAEDCARFTIKELQKQGINEISLIKLIIPIGFGETKYITLDI